MHTRSRLPCLNTFVVAAALLLLLFSPLITSQPFEPHTPETPLGFSLETPDGNRLNLEDLQGRVVLVNFWATWCTPCIREMPELMQLKKQYSEKPLEVIAINVGESASKAQKFAESIHFNLPVLLDRDSALFYGSGGTVLPTSYLIDHQGEVKYRALGDPGWFDVPTQELIDNLLQGVEN